MKLLPLLLILITTLTAYGWCEAPVDIQAIIQIESGGNPNAYNSKSGAVGLMQITPIVLEEFNNRLGEWNNKYNVGMLYDNQINVALGTWYLNRIWEHYLPHYGLEQSIDNLLIAYNFGIGNLVKYHKGEIPLPKETRDYLRKYKKLMEEKDG